VGYGKTVWYDFFPDHDGHIEIRTSGLGNVIAIYTYDAHTLLPHQIQCGPGSSYPSNDLFWGGVSSAAARNPSVLDQTACPTPLLNPAGAEYVFGQGSDGRLWEQWYSGTRWTRPARLHDGTLGSSPAVAVHGDGQQDVFWRCTNGDLWETWFTGQ
jgi:hypothetical protein